MKRVAKAKVNGNRRIQSSRLPHLAISQHDLTSHRGTPSYPPRYLRCILNRNICTGMITWGIDTATYTVQAHNFAPSRNSHHRLDLLGYSGSRGLYGHRSSAEKSLVSYCPLPSTDSNWTLYLNPVNYSILELAKLFLVACDSDHL